MPDRFSSAGLRLIFIQQIAVVEDCDNDCDDGDDGDDGDDDDDDGDDDCDDANPLCRAADSRLKTDIFLANCCWRPLHRHCFDIC